MLSSRQMLQPISQENPLYLSWHDTQMLASLNPQNVMDYFCRKSNPFYDRMCNNESIRMQRLGLENLNNMVGLEYILLHVHEPILYIVRKQHRHSPTEATPIADYYIIGGWVYKAPDLANVINSRILSTVTNLQFAFEEASSYSRYHPNKGYSWDFTTNKALSDKSKAAAKKESATNKDESGTVFQMQRVDMLLAELLRKFPPPIPPNLHQQQLQPQSQGQTTAQMNIQDTANASQVDGNQTNSSNSNNVGNTLDISTATATTAAGTGAIMTTLTSATITTTTNQTIDIKTETIDMKPPLEKKPKI